jgi:hypothetical protein
MFGDFVVSTNRRNAGDEYLTFACPSLFLRPSLTWFLSRTMDRFRLKAFRNAVDLFLSSILKIGLRVFAFERMLMWLVA